MHVIDSLILLNDSAVDAHDLNQPTFWVADDDLWEYGCEDMSELWRRSDVGIIYSKGTSKAPMETIE